MSDRQLSNTDRFGVLWAFASGPARNTTRYRSAQSKPTLAGGAVITSTVTAAAGVASLFVVAADPPNVTLSLVSGILFGVAIFLFILALFLAGDRLAQTLVSGLRMFGRLLQMAMLWLSGLSCVAAFVLLVYAIAVPGQRQSFFAIVAIAVVGALSAECAVLSTPALVSTRRHNSLLGGTIAAVLFFAATFLGVTALIFAVARNGISQNIPTVLAVFVLLIGWAWAVHRDGVKRRDELEQTLTGLLLAITYGREVRAATLALESVVLRQERREFAATPPPLAEPLRATLFYAIDAVTGFTPHQLSIYQQGFFERELPQGTITARDLQDFVARLRLRILLGSSGLALNDARRHELLAGEAN